MIFGFKILGCLATPEIREFLATHVTDVELALIDSFRWLASLFL